MVHFMPQIIWRILIAVVAVVFFYAILPPLLNVLGFPITNGDLWTVIRLCVAAGALGYIIWGPAVWTNRPPAP